jgi:hypothetical protein
MQPKAIIDVLNNLTVGEFSRLEGRLREVREQVTKMGHDEIAALLGEAQQCLVLGDMKTFRRKIQHAVSRLGHLQ